MALRSEDVAPAHGAVVYEFPLHRVRPPVSRRIVRRRRAAAAVATVALCAALSAGAIEWGAEDPVSRPAAPASVVVGSGETLWDLAERYAAPGTDVRSYVDALVDLNGTGALTRAGQRLRLPR
jgi:hypothetical protein